MPKDSQRQAQGMARRDGERQNRAGGKEAPEARGQLMKDRVCGCRGRATGGTKQEEAEPVKDIKCTATKAAGREENANQKGPREIRGEGNPRRRSIYQIKAEAQ